MGWRRRVGTQGRGGPTPALTHLPRQAVHCLPHLPQVSPGLLSTPGQALHRSPLRTFPLTLCLGHRHPVRPGAWTGRVDRQTGTPLTLSSCTQASHRPARPTTHPPGLAQPLPTPAAPGESVGIGTERKTVLPHLQEEEAQAGRWAACPTTKGCTCVLTAAPSVSPKRAAAQCPSLTNG